MTGEVISLHLNSFGINVNRLYFAATGRFDLKIPDFVVKELGIEQLLEPILTRLRGIMSHTPPPELRTHNIVFVPVGSPAQDWHCDDSFYKGKQHRYFTIMVHLNPIDSLCGGTEIWSTDLKSEDLVRASTPNDLSDSCDDACACADPSPSRRRVCLQWVVVASRPGQRRVHTQVLLLRKFRVQGRCQQRQLRARTVEYVIASSGSTFLLSGPCCYCCFA